MKVVVVGAGIIGASIAYNLAVQGAEVTVVDGARAQATAASFGWINASFYQDTAHHQLRCEGIAAYGRLMSALPDLPVKMCGALWWESAGADLLRMQEELENLGYPVTRLDRDDLRKIEPDLADHPQTALQFTSEGCAEPMKLVERLLDVEGIRVIRGCHVEELLEVGGTVRGVNTSLGEIVADQVVIAAGVGAQALLAPMGIEVPMLTRPGAIVQTQPVSAQISNVLVTPQGEVRQLANGRLISPAAANHQGDASEVIDAPLSEIADRTAARLARLIGHDHLEWMDVAVGYRPVPEDGLPVLGAVGPTGLHVAVLHSGVTLAAVTGEIIAALVLQKASNAQTAMLASYRADRFSAG